jgi:hypothetical protein
MHYPSVVEDRQVEMAEAVEVGDQVDPDDLPARDREAEYNTRRAPFRLLDTRMLEGSSNVLLRYAAAGQAA